MEQEIVQLCRQIAGAFRLAASGTFAPGSGFDVRHVSPGRYKVLVTAFDGRTRLTTAFVQTEFEVATRDLDLGQLYPVAPARLTGKVTVAGQTADRPLPGSLVVALERRGRPMIYGEELRTAVKQDGQFALENVFVDDYGLSVSGLPNGYYVQSAVQSGRDADDNPVRPDRGEVSITIAADGPSIAGRTVDGSGRSAPDATVILISKDTTMMRSQQSDQNGGFEFGSGIPPGEYKLIALAGLEEGEDQDPDLIREHIGSATEVAAPAKTSKSITLTVQRIR